MIPDQAVTAHFHSVGLCKADNLIPLAEIKLTFVLPNAPPLHGVFRFNHVEFTAQKRRIRGFLETSGTNRSANKDLVLVCFLTKGLCVSEEGRNGEQPDSRK